MVLHVVEEEEEKEEEEEEEEKEERRALRHLKQGPNLKGVGKYLGICLTCFINMHT